MYAIAVGIIVFIIEHHISEIKRCIARSRDDDEHL